ncbi:MAG: methyltransferase domain-containing protein [Archaeoglobaceae archaeon]
MWDTIAERYHLWTINNRWFYYLLGLEIKNSVKDAERIIDIGAGPGILSEELKNLFPEAEIICIDLSSEMCIISGGIRCKAECLPFRNEVFDVAIFCFSLHELSVECALKEAYRVLKRGGFIFIIDLDRDAPEIIKKLWKIIFSRLISPDYASKVYNSWRAFEKCEDIAERLKKMNFDVELSKGAYGFKISAKKI